MAEELTQNSISAIHPNNSHNPAKQDNNAATIHQNGIISTQDNQSNRNASSSPAAAAGPSEDNSDDDSMDESEDERNPNNSSYNQQDELSDSNNNLNLSSSSGAMLYQTSRSVRPLVWTCANGCGRTYKKSSGRSIRKHVLECYREYHPEVKAFTDAQLFKFIEKQQDLGYFESGLRAWRIRQPRRLAYSLPETEKWECPHW
jgi:hypothetical protein